MKELLKDLWLICMCILCIQIWTFPLFENYNMDLNKVPKTKVVIENTRFDYIDDLIKPVGLSAIVGITLVVVAPASVVLFGTLEYDLITNKIKA